jgi:hypothetical protein
MSRKLELTKDDYENWKIQPYTHYSLFIGYTKLMNIHFYVKNS